MHLYTSRGLSYLSPNGPLGFPYVFYERAGSAYAYDYAPSSTVHRSTTDDFFHHLCEVRTSGLETDRIVPDQRSDIRRKSRRRARIVDRHPHSQRVDRRRASEECSEHRQ
jgi:hypothetical protein